MEKGILYIVATPIGNLDDITLRAVKILQAVDVIVCEDSRVSATLLKKIGIEKRLLVIHEHTDSVVLRQFVQSLADGVQAALITDAGTPAIADPGTAVVAMVAKLHPEVKIVPIPGASAVVSALSVSGMYANQFTFWGFVPHKKGRVAFFQEIENSEKVSVLFETPQRIAQTMESLAGFAQPSRKICVVRELSKQFETVYRGTVADAATLIPEKEMKGEFVLVIDGL